MKNLINFKIFESSESSEYIDLLTIKDLFIDLLDEGYEMNTYNKDYVKIGKYFFEFKKLFSDEDLGYTSIDHVYGYTDLDSIKLEIDKSLSIIDESRSRLNDIGYTIAFEFEFNFSLSSMMVIVCHMHHSKYDQED